MKALAGTLFSPLGGILFLGLIAQPLIVPLSASPQVGKPVLVIVSPWEDARPVIRDAGGIVMASGLLPFFAMSYDSAPDHVARLREAGALIVSGSEVGSLLCR